MKRIAYILTTLCVSMLTSCGGHAPVNTFAEADDPHADTLDSWRLVPRGLHAAWGTDCDLFSRTLPPEAANDGLCRLTAWRGERVQAQLALWSREAMPGAECRVGELRSETSVLPASAVQVRFVRYTLADEASEACRCSKPEGHPAALVPDMLDTLARYDIPALSTRPVWISVDVPADAEPGVYHAEVEVSRSGAALSLEVEVLGRTLPAPSEWRYHLDLWQHPAAVARVEGVECWSDEHFAALEREMKPLAAAGQKVITATLNKDPWNHQCYDAYEDMIHWTRRADGSWSYDYGAFDRWVELMMSLGIKDMINCYSMVPWNCELQYLDEAADSTVTVRAEPGTELFVEMWTPFLKDFSAHLDAKGWLGITNIAMDERSPEAMDEAVKVLASAAPAMGFALADNHKSYKRYTNMRDVCVSVFQQVDNEDLVQRRRNGFVTTYYVCCSSFFPNTLTYSRLWEAELLGWYSVAAGFDGMLRWSYNSWPENPAVDSRFGHFASGDTFLIYPGGRTSMRFEKLRDGIQMAEKVRLLREEFAAAGNTEALADLEAALAAMRTMRISDPGEPWYQALISARSALDAASRTGL